MLQEAHRLRFDKLIHHIAQDSDHRKEAFIRMADVRKSRLVKEDLLDYENRDGFGQLRASLHDAQAKRDDLGGEKEVDDGGVVVLLDESANHAQ